MRWSRELRRGVPACLLAGLGLFGVGRTFVYPEAARSLVGGGVACLIAGAGLWLEARWARWMTLGLILAVFGNAFSALALGETLDRYPRFGFYTIALCVSAGAMIAGALLLGAKSRDQFEPGWSLPALTAVRISAVLIACVGPVAAMDVIFWPTGHPSSIWTFLVLLAGFLLLGANRIAGLPLSIVGLLMFGGSDIAMLARLRGDQLIPWLKWSFEQAARFTEGSFLFYGALSRFAWIPALFSLCIAAVMIGHRARRA